MNKLITLIKNNEGLMLKPYQDTKGFWTFGIGRCYQTYPLTFKERVKVVDLLGEVKSPKVEWTINETTNILSTLNRVQAIEVSEYFLLDALEEIIKHLNTFSFYTKLDEVRQAVWVDWAYNMGLSTVIRFNQTISMFMIRDFIGISKYCLTWTWADQVGKNPPSENNPRGQRAWIISEMIRSGKFPDWCI